MYKKGQHKFQCQRCGSIYMSEDMVEDGYDKGLVVCRFGCNDTPHPVDYIRAIKDDPSVEDARPLDWVEVSDVYPNGVSRDDLV